MADSLCNRHHQEQVQWNLSIKDTIGTQLAVLYREVSPIQRQIGTQLYVVGTADSVLISEVFCEELFHCSCTMCEQAFPLDLVMHMYVRACVRSCQFTHCSHLATTVPHVLS